MSRIARLALIACSVTLLFACNYRPPPTGPSTVSTTVTTTVTNNPTPTPPSGGGPGTPTPSGGTRTPDPVTGVLPLPTYGAQVLQQYASSAAGINALTASCAAGTSTPYAFLDGLVDALRKQDARWGYLCKRGVCADISLDVVAYHATSGPDVTGATGVIAVDVVEDYCGSKSAASWSPFAYDPAGLWSSRGRF